MPSQRKKPSAAREGDAQRETERLEAQRRTAAGDMPWLHEKGVQAVVDAVRDLTFPASAEEISQCAGERYVQASSRLTLPIAEVVAHLPEQEFGSLAEFETAVLKHWQGIRFLEVPEEQRSPEGGFQPTQRGNWPHHAGHTPQGLRHIKHEGSGPGPKG